MFNQIFEAFVLGLLTPLTAVCVLPLYPAFLIFLSNQVNADKTNRSSNKWLLPMLSLVIVSGVISFMFLLGLIFTFIFKVSLTNVIGVVSPIAFSFLALISLLLIFDVDFSKFLPKFNVAQKVNHNPKPLRNAYLYGFFFGAIVVPCNPLFIAVLFTRVASFGTFASGLMSFVAFGVGIGAPLIAFSLLSSNISNKIIGWLTKNKRPINVISGLIMLGISLYYLIFVFNVFG